MFMGVSLLVSFAACSTAPKSPSPLDQVNWSGVHDSRVEISYVLGHDRRQLIAHTDKRNVLIREVLDREVLDEGKVDQTKYSAFLKKAYEFALSPRRSLSGDSTCRTPFTVTVDIDKENRTVSGCRDADETALSRLIKDGEFLLYSKK